MERKLYWCRRPFDYDSRLSFDREQIVELRGLRNDEKLIRLGYVQEMKGEDFHVSECPQCQAKFISMNGRDGHVKERHRQFVADREVPPTKIYPGRERDELYDGHGQRVDIGVSTDAVDAERERELDNIAPLHLDKTAASRASGDATYEVDTISKAAPRKRGRPRKLQAVTA